MWADQRGDHEIAHALLDEGLAIFRALSDRPGEARALIIRCAKLYERGDFAAARGYGEQGLTANRGIGHPQRIARSLHYLGLIAAAEGNHAAARAQLEESLALFRTVGYGYAVADVLHALGWLRLESGEREAARALFAESLSFAREHGDASLLPLVMEGIAALAARDDPARAARLAGMSAMLRAAPGWSASSVVVWRHLIPHPADAMGTPQGLPATATPFAGDHALSLDAAIAEAAVVVGPTAAIPLGGPETAIPAPSAYPAGLSAREAEVLRLVAQGRTNREIAAALFLSEHTIRHHLTHILAKTDAANRAEAAAFAQRHGLA